MQQHPFRMKPAATHNSTAIAAPAGSGVAVARRSGRAEFGLPQQKVLAIDGAVTVAITIGSRAARGDAKATLPYEKVLSVDTPIGIEVTGTTEKLRDARCRTYHRRANR